MIQVNPERVQSAPAHNLPFYLRLLQLMTVIFALELALRVAVSLVIGEREASALLDGRRIYAVMAVTGAWIGWQAWRDGAVALFPDASTLGRVLVTLLGVLAGGGGALCVGMTAVVLVPLGHQFSGSGVLDAISVVFVLTAVVLLPLRVRSVGEGHG